MTKDDFLSREPDGTDLDCIIATASINLSERQVSELESLLVVDEHNLSARLKLLGYYFKFLGHRVNACKRQKHVIWMIDHRPADFICGTPRLAWDGRLPDLQQEALEHWLRQVDLNPADPAILGNAAYHVGFCDLSLAESLYQRAAVLQPDNEHWRHQLAWIETMK